MSQINTRLRQTPARMTPGRQNAIMHGTPRITRSTPTTSKTPLVAPASAEMQRRVLRSATKTPKARASTVHTPFKTPSAAPRPPARKRKSAALQPISESNATDMQQHGNTDSGSESDSEPEPPVPFDAWKAPTPKRRVKGGSRRTSQCWNYVDETMVSRSCGRKYNRCNIVLDDGTPCHHPFYWPTEQKKAPTTNMWGHFEKYHGISNLKGKSLIKPGTGADLITNLDKVQLQDANTLLAWGIATGSLPFIVVENTCLRRFCELISASNYQLPHRSAIRNKVLFEAEKVEAKIKSLMSATTNGVSLGFDAWTSQNQLPFMCITAHYIDDNWVMHRQLLGFEHFLPPHTAEATAGLLRQIIVKNHLQHRFMGLTGDSASSNTASVPLLSKLLESHGANWSHLEKYFHCSAHVFNLVAHAVCDPYTTKVKINGREQVVENDADDTSEQFSAPPGKMSDALSKLAAMARKLNKSTTMLEEWKRICRLHGLAELKLITAAATRWNSRYEQIERAKNYRAVYHDITVGNQNYTAFAISDSEWALLDWLHAILYHLNVCSKYVGVTKSPSISFMIPCFSRLIDLFENEPDQTLELPEERKRRKEGTEAAIKKLHFYYQHSVNNPYYTFGMILDPRFSWEFIRNDLSWDKDRKGTRAAEQLTVEEALDRIDDCEDIHAKYNNAVFIEQYGPSIVADPRRLWKTKFIHLYNDYQRSYFPDVLESEPIQPKRTASNVFQLHRRHVSAVSGSTLTSSLREGLDEDGVPHNIIPVEVSSFLGKRDDRESDLETDPLAWWKLNERRYPVIAKIAKDILAMQVTSVETERVNSGGRTVMNWNQSKMGVESVSASVKVKHFALYNGTAESAEQIARSEFIE